MNITAIVTVADDGASTGRLRREFDIPAGTLQFRFYKALTDWDGGDSWGTQVDDAGVECAFKDNVFEGVGMAGKGTWLFNDFPGGKVKMTVNMNTEKVKFELE